MLGAAPQWTFDVRISGLKTRTKPRRTSSTCVAKSITASVIDQLRRLLDADDVEGDEDDDHDRPRDDVPRVRLQRLPEDREIVRNEERRRRDGDDVHEHLRPRRVEADELVEGMPREARGASRFG